MVHLGCQGTDHDVSCLQAWWRDRAAVLSQDHERLKTTLLRTRIAAQLATGTDAAALRTKLLAEERKSSASLGMLADAERTNAALRGELAGLREAAQRELGTASQELARLHAALAAAPPAQQQGGLAQQLEAAVREALGLRHALETAGMELAGVRQATALEQRRAAAAEARVAHQQQLLHQLQFQLLHAAHPGTRPMPGGAAAGDSTQACPSCLCCLCVKLQQAIHD